MLKQTNNLGISCDQTTYDWYRSVASIPGSNRQLFAPWEGETTWPLTQVPSTCQKLRPRVRETKLISGTALYQFLVNTSFKTEVANAVDYSIIYQDIIKPAVHMTHLQKWHLQFVCTFANQGVSVSNTVSVKYCVKWRTWNACSIVTLTASQAWQ